MNDKLSVLIKAFLEGHPNGVEPSEMLILSRDMESIFKGEESCDFGDAYGQINDGFQKVIEA